MCIDSGCQTHEVEDPLGILPVGDRIGLERVNHVRELDRVADEEDRQVVADQIPVAVLGVELDGESARVAQRLGRVPPWMTVEKRTKTGVRLPFSWKSFARVYVATGSSPTVPYASKKPCAPAPRA